MVLRLLFHVYNALIDEQNYTTEMLLDAHGIAQIKSFFNIF